MFFLSGCVFSRTRSLQMGRHYRLEGDMCHHIQCMGAATFSDKQVAHWITLTPLNFVPSRDILVPIQMCYVHVNCCWAQRCIAY